MSNITAYDTIRHAISVAQKNSLLASKKPILIAVSKFQPAEKIEPLLQKGHFIYGENRVQEIADKWTGLRKRYDSIQLHLIGSLQTNKVKQALTLCDAIHTVDRVSLVDEIVRVRSHASDIRCQQFFIQVNTGEETQKGGVTPELVPELLSYCHKQELVIDGLMGIPPLGDRPAPHFALLYKIARDHGLQNVSMGMSADFQTAIRLGATHVRIGTALFGERL